MAGRFAGAGISAMKSSRSSWGVFFDQSNIAGTTGLCDRRLPTVRRVPPDGFRLSRTQARKISWARCANRL